MPNIILPALKIECPPTIKPGAQITFCGEAPGWQEVRDREGFVGGSGRLLTAICNNAQIDISKCNKTNVAKNRPPNDDFSTFYTTPKRGDPTPELLWWIQLLQAELTKYKPNLVVALGGEALRALTGKVGITKWRGSLLDSTLVPNLKVIAEVHPAFIMRNKWEYYYLAIRTFKAKIKPESLSPNWKTKEPGYVSITDPTFNQALEFIIYVSNSRVPWYLDVETRGDTLSCFGLYSESRPGLAICIPIQDTTGPHWSPMQEASIWRSLSQIAPENLCLRNQNILYDIDYLLDYRIEPQGIDFDPMIGMNVAYPEFPKGLDFTTQLYTNHEFYKDEGKTWGKKVPDQIVRAYNCKDMITTPQVSNHVIADLKEGGLYEIYKKRSHKMLGVAIEMQRNKLKLNKDWHFKLANYLTDERTKTHQELTTLINTEINVKSWDQVQQLLYVDLKLPIKKKHTTGNTTTEENALKELRAEYPECLALNLILKERHLRTKESNNINVQFDNNPDGSLSLGYMANIAGTKSGRWAFSKSPKWRGSSPQTIPKVMRLMYEPPSGSVFWQRDLSQAEVRVVAWLANCRFLLDVFAGKYGPYKIHSIVGGMVWKVPPGDITEAKDILRYDTAKSGVHAYDYMIQAKRLAVEANISLQMAQEFIAKYEALVPEISSWWQQIKQTVIKTGKLTTPMGRVRQAYKACGMLANTGEISDEILRDLVSYIPQSTVPDVLNEGMWELWNKLGWVRWHQQGHDSYLASGDPKRTAEFAEKSEIAADVHFSTLRSDCFIPSEFQWGYLWGAMLKYKSGEPTTYEAWQSRAKQEGYFEEEKIKTKLYSLF